MIKYYISNSSITHAINQANNDIENHSKDYKPIQMIKESKTNGTHLKEFTLIVLFQKK